MQIKQGPLLSNVDHPADLRKLETQQLPQFSEELRITLLIMSLPMVDILEPVWVWLN